MQVESNAENRGASSFGAKRLRKIREERRIKQREKQQQQQEARPPLATITTANKPAAMVVPNDDTPASRKSGFFDQTASGSESNSDASLAIAVTMSEDSKEPSSNDDNGSTRSTNSSREDDSRDTSAWAMLGNYSTNNAEGETPARFSTNTVTFERITSDARTPIPSQSTSVETEDSLHLNEALDVQDQDEDEDEDDDVPSGRQNPMMNQLLNNGVSHIEYQDDTLEEEDVGGSDISQGHGSDRDISTLYSDSLPTAKAAEPQVFRTPRVRWRTNEQGDLSPDEVCFTDTKAELPRDLDCYDEEQDDEPSFDAPISDLTGGPSFFPDNSEEKKEWNVEDVHHIDLRKPTTRTERPQSIETFSVDSTYEDNTQISFASLQPSESGLMEMNGQVTSPSVEGPDANANVAYLARISELEQSLKAKEAETAHKVNELQSELIQVKSALTDVTTPRGTTIKKDSFQEILSRNNTLVHEVRYADQICIELEGNLKAARVEIGLLREQNQKLEQENDDLRQQRIEDESVSTSSQLTVIREKDNESQSSGGSTDRNTIRQLRKQLTQAEKEIRHLQEHTVDEEIIRELVQEMQEEVGEFESTMTDEENTPANVLQELLHLLKERNQSDRNAHEAKIKALKANIRFVHEYSAKQETELRTEFEMKEKEYTNKIKSLQESVSHINTHKYLYDDGPTSPRLQMADKSVAKLERDLVHAKAEIVSWKRKAEEIIMSSESSTEGNSKDKSNLMVMMKVALTQMAQQYDDLNESVEQAIDVYSDRLDRMRENVFHLRGSLDFETESVSTRLHDEPASAQKNTSDDQMFDLMEAGSVRGGDNRSLFSEDPDETFTSEGFTRLLMDDTTLASFKRHANDTPLPNDASKEQAKEFLEAASKEYQKLRQQFSTMQEDYSKEVDTQRRTIEILEKENGTLSLQCHRHGEEMAENVRMLEQAQKEIDKLQSEVDLITEEKDQVTKSLEDINEKMETLKKEKADWSQVMEKAVSEIHHYKDLLATERAAKESTTTSLKESQSAYEKAKQDIRQLKMQMTVTRAETIESNQAKIKGLEQSLLDARSIISDMEHSQETHAERMERLKDEKRQAHEEIAELNRAHQEFRNFAEDQIRIANLESEDLRNIQARCKSEISRLQNELETSRNEFGDFKGRVTNKMEEKRCSIAELRRQQAVFERREQNFMGMRHELFGYLTSANVCANVVEEIRSVESSMGGECVGEYEVKFWREVIPVVGSTIVDLSHIARQASDLNDENLRKCTEIEHLEANKNEIMAKLEQSEIKLQKTLEILEQATNEIEQYDAQHQSLRESYLSLQARENQAVEQLELVRMELEKTQEENELAIAQLKTEREGAERRSLEASEALRRGKEKLASVTKSLRTSTDENAQFAGALESKENEVAQLRTKYEMSDSKCNRLREYGKKIEGKCSDWEKSYAEQSKELEKQVDKNSKLREKLKAVATKYKELVEIVKKKSKVEKADRAKREAEQASIQGLQAELDAELKNIVRDLSMSNKNNW